MLHKEERGNYRYVYDSNWKNRVNELGSNISVDVCQKVRCFVILLKETNFFIILSDFLLSWVPQCLTSMNVRIKQSRQNMYTYV